MYKLTPITFVFGQTSGVQQSVTRIADNACIPFNPANTDYAEYLKWVEAGNTPLPADTQTE